jgi:hypothetical protein
LKKGGKGWEKNGKECSHRDGRGLRKKCNIEERRERERKNVKECSNIDGWRRRKRRNIEERREREKKMGKNAATEMEGG